MTKIPSPFGSELKTAFMMEMMKDRGMSASEAADVLVHGFKALAPEDAPIEPDSAHRAKHRTLSPPEALRLTEDQAKVVDDAMQAETRRLYPLLFNQN